MPRLWVGGVILFWLAVGVAVPLFFDFSGDELQLDNAGVVAAPGDSFQITDTLLLDKTGSATISGGTLAIAVPKGKPLTAEGAAAQLKSGDAVLLLQNSELAIGSSDDSVAASGTAAPLVQALQDGRFKALGLRQSTIIVGLPNGHRERLARADVRIVRSSSGAIEAKGSGYWRGQRSEFSMTSSAVIKSGKVPVKLSFKATLLDFEYAGHFELSGAHAIVGQAKVHLSDTDTLAKSLGTTWPVGSSFQDIRIEGPMRWQSGILAFDEAKVSVGDNRANGTVSLNTTAEQALISSTLAFDKLDIAPYLPGGSTDHSRLAWQLWNKLVGTLAQPAAPHINADIRISTKTLISGAHALGPAAATVSLKNGKLSADVAEITLAEGRATGQISIDFNRYIPKLALRGQLEEIATGEWVEKLIGQRHIAGRGRIVADLTSQGSSIQQIVGDLSGQLEFALPEGGTIGLSLAELNSAHDKMPPPAPEDVFAQASRGSSPLSELEAVWKIKDGIATVVKASAVHPAGRLKMSGKYDLTRQTFDLRLLSIVGSAAAAGGGAKPKQPADKNDRAVTVPLHAMLVGLKSLQTGHHRPNALGAHPVDIQLRALTGTLGELERNLGPDHDKGPRRGL